MLTTETIFFQLTNRSMTNRGRVSDHRIFLKESAISYNKKKKNTFKYSGDVSKHRIMLVKIFISFLEIAGEQ